jgi:pimeloyl-ACP methyl ester carboxylesterase
VRAWRRSLARVLGRLAGGALLLVGMLVLLGSAARRTGGVVDSPLWVAGTPVRYIQVGRGPDVLLIHGSPGSVEDWEPLVSRLRTKLRVTAFDRPGHGLSGPSPGPDTPQANAEVALSIIRALNLRDVVVVGHSFGGSTALALAAMDPAQARAFVVVGSRCQGPVRVESLYRLLAVPRLGEGLAWALGWAVGPSRVASGIRESFGPDAGSIPPGFIELRQRLWSRPVVTATLSRERVELEDALGRLRPRLRGIRKPVTFVYGEDDPNTRIVAPIVSEVRGASLVVLPHTGHYLPIERPDELAAVVARVACSPPDHPGAHGKTRLASVSATLEEPPIGPHRSR